MNKMASKEEVRKVIRGYRMSLSEESAVMKSITISEKLLQMEEYKKADCIYCYIDFRNEVKTKPIIRRALGDGKKVAVPRVENGKMEFYYFEGYDRLQPGTYGVLEPVDGILATNTDALLIMSGVAFDQENHRIGYGGGYYDRYLERPNQHFKIALAYQFQIFRQIPFEIFDIQPDLILTEECIQKRKAADALYCY